MTDSSPAPDPQLITQLRAITADFDTPLFSDRAEAAARLERMLRDEVSFASVVAAMKTHTDIAAGIRAAIDTYAPQIRALQLVDSPLRERMEWTYSADEARQVFLQAMPSTPTAWTVHTFQDLMRRVTRGVLDQPEVFVDVCRSDSATTKEWLRYVDRRAALPTVAEFYEALRTRELESRLFSEGLAPPHIISEMQEHLLRLGETSDEETNELHLTSLTRQLRRYPASAMEVLEAKASQRTNTERTSGRELRDAVAFLAQAPDGPAIRALWQALDETVDRSHPSVRRIYDQIPSRRRQIRSAPQEVVDLVHNDFLALATRLTDNEFDDKLRRVTTFIRRHPDDALHVIEAPRATMQRILDVVVRERDNPAARLFWKAVSAHEGAAEEFATLLEPHALHVVTAFVDASGHREKRPRFNELMQMIQDQPDVLAIVLRRHPRVSMRLQDRLLNERRSTFSRPFWEAVETRPESRLASALHDTRPVAELEAAAERRLFALLNQQFKSPQDVNEAIAEFADVLEAHPYIFSRAVLADDNADDFLAQVHGYFGKAESAELINGWRDAVRGRLAPKKPYRPPPNRSYVRVGQIGRRMRDLADDSDVVARAALEQTLIDLRERPEEVITAIERHGPKAHVLWRVLRSDDPKFDALRTAVPPAVMDALRPIGLRADVIEALTLADNLHTHAEGISRVAAMVDEAPGVVRSVFGDKPRLRNRFAKALARSSEEPVEALKRFIDDDQDPGISGPQGPATSPPSDQDPGSTALELPTEETIRSAPTELESPLADVSDLGVDPEGFVPSDDDSLLDLASEAVSRQRDRSAADATELDDDLVGGIDTSGEAQTLDAAELESLSRRLPTRGTPGVRL